MPIGDDVDLASIAKRTRGYTGADLEDLVRRAGLLALREEVSTDVVPMRFFEESLKEGRASVTEEMEREYEQIQDELKREGPYGRKQMGFHVAAAT